MLAKPAKGRQVEGAIIQMAQTGQIGGKLSEEELIGLLERFSGSTRQTTVKFDRRRAALDSDSDWKGEIHFLYWIASEMQMQERPFSTRHVKNQDKNK